jgi:GntR family transcriptional regulator / MocR family aminotransferase
MKELNLPAARKDQPKYLQLAEALRAAIRRGRIVPGEILPSSRDLARQFGYHRHTVMAALAELEAEGWVESHEKRHCRVVGTLPSTFLRPMKSGTPHLQFSPRPPAPARSLAIGDYRPQPKAKHSFPSGYPDPRLFPLRELKSHLQDAMRSRDILLYGDPRGEARLLQQVATYLRRARGITGREVLVTHGSQEAIFQIAQLLIRPGDCVAVEALGYPPALEALRFAGGRLQPLRVDSEGLVVEDLERLLRRQRVRLLYLTPLHQYPTTTTLSAERRLRLYELAYRHGVYLLEDDYDHEFHYTSQPVAPLASFDPGEIVCYVSTFSKILFPSARLGFMAVPRGLAGELAKLKRISSRQNEPLLQTAIASWMQEGGFERHLRRVRRTYAERLESMEKNLQRHRAAGREISWKSPGGGMALWLNVHRNSTLLAERAMRAGALVNPERSYRCDGKDGEHLRLGFTGQTPEENVAGLEALFSVF